MERMDERTLVEIIYQCTRNDKRRGGPNKRWKDQSWVEPWNCNSLMRLIVDTDEDYVISYTHIQSMFSQHGYLVVVYTSFVLVGFSGMRALRNWPVWNQVIINVRVQARRRLSSISCRTVNQSSHLHLGRGITDRGTRKAPAWCLPLNTCRSDLSDWLQTVPGAGFRRQPRTARNARSVQAPDTCLL
jgi:hypothetical protein